MGIWTHVVGCIRLDQMGIILGGSHPLTVKSVEEILGPICTFHNWYDSTRLPCGSEGSLQYRVIKYREPGLPWVAIPIWGDLRSYDNIYEIKNWWKDILKSFEPAFVRDACLKIEVDGRKRPVILYR